MPFITVINRQKIMTYHDKVIKAADYSELKEIKACTSLANRYLDEVKQTIEHEKEQARKLGYEQGYAEGKEELSHRMIDIVMRLESSYLGLEARIINTVMQAITNILGELEEKQLLEKIVRQCMRGLKEEKRISLRIAAEQSALVNKMMTDIIAGYPSIEFIDVISDPRLALNSCIVETEYGAVDGSIDTQLKAIRKGLLSSFALKRPQEKLDMDKEPSYVRG